MKTIKFAKGSLKINHKGDAPLTGKNVVNMTTTMASGDALSISYGDDMAFVFYSNSSKIIGGCLLTRERAESGYLKTELRQVMANYGLLPEDIHCYLGPSLTFAHCPMGEDALESKFIRKGYNGACKRTSGVAFLDLQVLETYYLRELGIPFDNIVVDEGDTFECDDLYFSPLRGDSEKNSLSIVLE